MAVRVRARIVRGSSHFTLSKNYLFDRFNDIFPQLAAVVFAALTISWFALDPCNKPGIGGYQFATIAATVNIIGWLLAAHFLLYWLKPVISGLLIRMAVSAIFWMLLVYMCVLFGFGWAFFVLLHSSKTTAAQNEHYSVTLLTVFDLLFGLGSPIEYNDFDFDETFRAEVGKPTFIYVIYIFYVIAAFRIHRVTLLRPLSAQYR